MKDKKILIIGPYASEYSLAKVNRSLGFALQELTADTDIRFYADEKFADRLPNKHDLKKYPQLAELQTKTLVDSSYAIFNNFPKSTSIGYGLDKIFVPVRVGYLAWEESKFPEKFVRECNKYLHGMMVTSRHVARVFRDSGISIPVVNVGEGINLQLEKSQEKYSLLTTKKYRFLHISSAHYRKGVDILLKAYFQKFSASDNVTLIIKLFPNPDSELQEILSELRKDKNKDYPEVVIINDPDLSDGEVASIIKQCHCLVSPSRAEGFGQPLAEAMLLQKPVITTNYSGQTDFCRNDNAYLLDYTLVNSRSQLFNPGAKLAEPDVQQLGGIMYSLFESGFSGGELSDKVKNAYDTVKDLSWEKTAEKVLNSLKYFERISSLKKDKLAVISTRNSVCGIADYTQSFYPFIESAFADIKYFANTDEGFHIFHDDDKVLRTWEYGENSFAKTVLEITNFKPEYLHVQYNPPFYSLAALGHLIEKITERKIKVYLTIHSLKNDTNIDTYLQHLKRCSRIYLHSYSDLSVLQIKGFQNVKYWPHGVKEFPEVDKLKLQKKLGLTGFNPVISSHGLIHERKGLLELLQAVKLLKKEYPDILFLSVNALNPNNITSSATFDRMKKLARDLDLQKNVIFISEFLAVEEIIKLLQASDVIVLPYQDVREGASGAVRTSFSAVRPVIITESQIMSELTAGYRIKSSQPEEIAGAVLKLINDEKLSQTVVAGIKKFILENSWEKITRDYLLELVNLK
ncbi:MAG TPA: glycosyltransferase [Candidatus Dojkabacteria bacterium]|nr:glycosyltransferase [Candidatus Dojkabacteria bacterium]